MWTSLILTIGYWATWHSLDLASTIGLKICSLPLFHSEFLHLILWVMNNFFPNNISDISQKRPIGLLTLNLLPFKIAKGAICAVSGSTRNGLFVMKTNTHLLESMLASFRRVACLFTIYSSGICMCTNGRQTGQSRISQRTTRLEMSLMFGSYVAV
jgi:hypothetical protein